jgi:hypothetical protein
VDGSGTFIRYILEGVIHMDWYSPILTRKQIEKLRDRAVSVNRTYTAPAKIRTDAWELKKVCEWLLHYMDGDILSPDMDKKLNIKRRR